MHLESIDTVNCYFMLTLSMFLSN